VSEYCASPTSASEESGLSSSARLNSSLASSPLPSASDARPLSVAISAEFRALAAEADQAFREIQLGVRPADESEHDTITMTEPPQAEVEVNPKRDKTGTTIRRSFRAW